MVHYDNPLTWEQGKGVWVDTRVRVGYTVEAANVGGVVVGMW